jgi:Asp-tRNA(Asn)/Glu-tRNA(Gln) amidotransferase A subunit family amidase
LIPRLSASGLVVEEANLPSIFSLAPAILRTMVRAEAAATHDSLIRNKPEIYGQKLKELVQTGMLVGAAAYLRAKRIRRHYQRDMLKLFERYDALLTPAATGTAPEGMPTGNPVMNAPWTLADFPTLTLPHALAANGLPLGIQLAAAPLQEGVLLEIAKAVEGVVEFNAKPKL